MGENWTRAKRDELARAHAAARQAFRFVDREDGAAVSRLSKARRRCIEAYWEALPRVPLSACPLCGHVLNRAFDPLGIDGWFWQEEMGDKPVQPPPCAHFAVLCGAVNLNGLPPRGGDRPAHLGPEVPYVVPKLLALPGLSVVISKIPLADGYTAYPIAYFAETLPRPTQLPQSWTKTTVSFTDASGEAWWTINTDPWDFELEPWIEQRKVHWIAPGDPDFRVLSPPTPCPYVGLPGRRVRIVIEQDRLQTEGLPCGEDPDPFE
jgi:hypothetical protein